MRDAMEALLVRDDDNELLNISELYFITPERVKRLGIPENLPELDDKYLDSTGPKYVSEKVEYLLSLGLRLPEAWVTEPGHEVSWDYVSVINRMYIIAGYFRSWGIWDDQREDEEIGEEEFNALIEEDNALLRSHIDGINGAVRWRKRIDSNYASTFEGHVRTAGRRANKDNKVSVDEMRLIMEMFETAFGARKPY